MKIIRDNRIYIQAKDIALLADSHMDVPQEIVFSINHTSSSRINNPERYLCFEGETAIRFFSNQDWIINYDEVNNLDVSGCLHLLGNNLDDKRYCIFSLEGVKSERVEEKLLDRCKFLDYKNSQLENIIHLKNDKKPLPLPKQLQDPTKAEKIVNGFMKIIKRS